MDVVNITNTSAIVEQIVTEVVTKVARRAADGNLVPMPEYLNSAQAAAFLSMTTGGLETMRKEGRGPRYCRASAKLVRYRPADLREWMDGFIREAEDDR